MPDILWYAYIYALHSQIMARNLKPDVTLLCLTPYHSLLSLVSCPVPALTIPGQLLRSTKILFHMSCSQAIFWQMVECQECFKCKCLGGMPWDGQGKN